MSNKDSGQLKPRLYFKGAWYCDSARCVGWDMTSPRKAYLEWLLTPDGKAWEAMNRKAVQ